MYRADQCSLSTAVGDIDHCLILDQTLNTFDPAKLCCEHQRGSTLFILQIGVRPFLQQIPQPIEIASLGDNMQRGFTGRIVLCPQCDRTRLIDEFFDVLTLAFADSLQEIVAVGKLGDEVALGRYQVAVDRMNPLWKKRAAERMGGMEALEKQLSGVAAQMVQQGISMISFKPQGQPKVYQVTPGKKVVKEGGVNVEKLVYTKWLVMVPTVTKFRIMREGVPKPLVIESISYQVAVSDKGKNDWTFIDGAGLKPADLRGLFITLPQDIELPPVEKREVR